jgi:hypothetical protein
MTVKPVESFSVSLSRSADVSPLKDGFLAASPAVSVGAVIRQA